MSDNEVVEHMLAADERCRLCSHHVTGWEDGTPRAGGNTCHQFNNHPQRAAFGATSGFYSHARISDIVCHFANVVMPSHRPEASLFCGRVLAREPPCQLFERSVPRENHELQ